MADDKNKEKNKATEQPSSDQIEQPKHKSILRFNISVSDPSSEDSFRSALSHAHVDVEEDEEDLTAKASGSVLKKYVLSPIRHSQPRSAPLGHCCMRTDEFPSISQNSSRQLFEIVRNSPTPSDADINLINATYLRKLDAVKEAILEGANVNTSRDRQTPLVIAAEIGDDRLVAYLLTIPNINPNFQNTFGQTALIVAIVKLLLDHKADVNLPDNMGKTPLLGAIFQKKLHLTKLLLAYGADCNKPDLYGETPLYAAAVKTPDRECVLTLLKVGASPECLSLSGVPLLSRAILYLTEFAIIETLVQYGASVNYADFITKKTPLHYAAHIDDLRVAKLLVNRGANMTLKTAYGFTPLQEAIAQKSVLVTEYLLLYCVPEKQKLSNWPNKGRTDVLNR